MSDRTLVAIETAIRIRHPAAIWIDALCVPFEEPTRSSCLSRLGEIYSQASEVVIVLSEPCSAMLTQISDSNQVDWESLLMFGLDDWASRVWTYQELVNANKIFFVAEGEGDSQVEVEDVFRNMTYAIDEHKKAQGYNSFKFRSLHPKLDDLESVFLDWKIGPYLERSAYQVISGMDQRDAAQTGDHFYAVVGAIGSSSADVPMSRSMHPAEHFMRTCEAKGDYSFIYTTAPRSTVFGKEWRPEPVDHLQAIFAWPSWGNQSGSLHPTHVQLDGMWRVKLGPLSSTARKFVTYWLLQSDPGSSLDNIPVQILRLLRLAGFSGCDDYLELENGYMFPHVPLMQTDGVFAAISTGVRMPLGSPGLLLRANGSNIYSWCGIGLFVGAVPESGENVNIG